MANKTTLVATLTSPPSQDGEEIAALAEDVGYLEVRADLVGELDPDWLRDRFPGGLIYTLRSRAEGGSSDAGRKGRRERLAAAAERFDLVDLEAERDLSTELLEEVPEEQRLLSWHGPSLSWTALRGRWERMAQTPARLYKLIPEARQEGDALQPLILLDALEREDVITFSSGEVGAWNRLVAPLLGSPLVYGSLGEQPGAPGQLGIDRLGRDFGLPGLPPADRLSGIVGRPVAHSLSPRLHNAAYRALGVSGLYVPFHAESFGDFWIDVVESGSLEIFGVPLRGLSVTSPFKEAALAVAGAYSPRADHIGAANTLIWDDGVWEAESTDSDGVVLALEAVGVKLRGARSAVVGCGGAGKAAAYGLEISGAEVTLVNRGEEGGRKAAAELHRPFVALADFDPGDYEIVVHATALGHDPDDALPFAVEGLQPGAVLVDMVYGAHDTALVESARSHGCRVVDGRSVLLHQAFAQFRLMTGEELPPELGREVLGVAEAHTAREEQS